jgi:hypothetical protein
MYTLCIFYLADPSWASTSSGPPLLCFPTYLSFGALRCRYCTVLRAKMAYEPVGRTNGSRMSLSDDLEPTMRYDAGSYNSRPSANDSVHHQTEDGVQNSKGATWSVESIKEQWPLQSQRLAPMTPLRGFIVVFDVILASMPIMFIGERGIC